LEIHRDTISDVIEDLAKHARDVTDFLVKLPTAAELRGIS